MNDRKRNKLSTKDLALNDIKNAKRGFMENVRKGTKYNTVITYTACSHIQQKSSVSVLKMLNIFMKEAKNSCLYYKFNTKPI